VIAALKTTVGDVARAVKGRILFGDQARELETICSDSRELETKNLFVPIVGEKLLCDWRWDRAAVAFCGWSLRRPC